MDDLSVQQFDITAMVRHGQEDDYDFVDSLSCPLTATAVDSLAVLAIFISKIKCQTCLHNKNCKLYRQFNN